MPSQTRAPARDAYVRAVAASRARERTLRLENLQRIDTALNQYIERLLAQLRHIPMGEATAIRRMAASQAIEIAERMRAGLRTELERAIATGRAASFDAILKLQEQATLQVAAFHGVPNSMLGAVLTPKVTMAGVWESLGKGAATWRTVLRGHVNGAVDNVQQIMTSGLLEGIGPSELAVRLRPYLQGSEKFQDAFEGAGEWTNKLIRDAGFGQEARQLRYNADRIAFSELHNARHEAEAQAYAADPFVAAVQWELSPQHGEKGDADECDGLAETDFYGLGDGIYPVTAVPQTPHPWCSCELVAVTRGPEHMHLPKPNPPLNPDAIVKGTGCD